jgi:hypothetical protein
VSAADSPVIFPHYIDLQREQLLDEYHIPRHAAAAAPPILDKNVLAVDISQLTDASAKGIIGRTWNDAEITDAVHLARRLRGGGEGHTDNGQEPC